MEAGAGEENFEALSLELRLTHKSWKARVSAYEQLSNAFKATVSEQDPIFREYSNSGERLLEWAKDSNAVSQEKGVDALCRLVEFGGRPTARTRQDVVPALVEKCLGAARAGTRVKANELCLLYVEVEEDMGDGVINDLILGLSAKQPKVVAGVVTVLKDLVLSFGPKSVSFKLILPLLPKIFAHADKTVRAEGTLLSLALHAWIGPKALEPHCASLKPVQIKELKEACDEADAKGEGFGKLKQTRFTRSQQRERAVKDAEGVLDGNAHQVDAEAMTEEEELPAEPEGTDPFEYAVAISILDALPSDFYTHLNSAKWKDRKELALDPLLVLLKTSIKLENGNYDELVRGLAGRMTDANVVCVTVAANCLEALALGLRTDFSRYQASVVALVLERTKEKKTSVLDALGGALDAVFLSVTIGDILDDVTLFSKHKNPSVKAETLKWLVRCLRLTTTAPSPDRVKPLKLTLQAGLEDSGEPVRVAAAEALGTLLKCIGTREGKGVDDQLEGMDPLRASKVKEWYTSAVVKCKVGKAAGPVRAAAPSVAPVAQSKPKPRAPIAKADQFGDEFPTDAAPPVRAPPKAAAPPGPRPLAKKPPTLSSTVPVVKRSAASTSAASKSAPARVVEPVRYKFTQEDAEEQGESALPSAVVAGLADANWKERLVAIEALHSWLSEGEIANIESELVVRYLAKRPGWKESNFQVGAKMFGIFSLLAEQSSSFTKAAAALSIPGLSDKLGDIKLKKPAGDALTLFAEKSSLQFVLSQAYDAMSKQKAPKAQADSLTWIEQSLREFGVAGLNVRELIEFCKVGLKSTNASVRTSATKTVTTIRLCLGSDIISFLEDLNPTLVATLKSECDKVEGEAAPVPTRSSIETAASATGGSGGAVAGAGGSDDALDQLFPRVDLEKLLTNANVNACNDANWKVRKEALETIQTILEANRRLKPSNLSDLTTALKLRMTDSNKVVQNLALDIIARVATGMGKPFERQARILAGAVATVLADQKSNIRASGLLALSAMADAAGLDTLISGFDKPLEAQNPILRKELLGWLEARFTDADAFATLDLAPIAGPVVSCLEDRNADVRKSALAILPMIVARAGYSHVLAQTSSLKPASRATVVPLIEAARNGASTESRPPTATAPLPRTGVSKLLRRPEAAKAPTPPPDEPARLGAPRPRPSLTSAKPKSGASSARATPVPVASSSTLKEPPFKSADGQAKLIRQSKDVGSTKWLVEGPPRPEQVEYLYAQISPHVSAELLGLLFSKDHNAERDYGIALSLLDDCAKEPGFAEQQYDLSSEELARRLIANVDLIFEYITLRIGLSSTTITVKCLDLIEHLLSLMGAEGHRLSDYEVNALLISLIGKVGDGKETIRARVRVIFKSFCTLYPFSKVFNVILDNGPISKNSRTRAESVEELGSLFQRYGVNILPIAKALPIIARLISDRDPAVRTAALTAIGAAYTLVGADVVYKHIGSIPDKERTMLEERLKRTSSPSRGSTIVNPGAASVTAPGTPSRLPARSVLGGASRIGAGLKRPISVSAPPASAVVDPTATTGLRRPVPISAPSNGIPRPVPSLMRAPIASTRATVVDGDDELGAEHLILSIVTEDYARSAEALKMVQVDIASDPDSLIVFADRLIDAISQQIQFAFTGLDRSTSQGVLRLCKHLMQTLSSFFDNKSLGEAVSADALTVLLAELAGRLLDTAATPETEAIASLSKVLNMVLIRIFHHTEQSACFTALFAVLRDATCDLRELEGQELTERAKYAELVMKCLWKVSKTVKESLESGTLSPARLLRDIDQFLIATPPAEWRRRSTDGIPLADMPLRTVKTILQQIVAVYGELVFDKLYEIDSAENSYVYQYLFRLANAPPAGTITDAASIDRASASQASGMSRAASTASTTSIARALPPSGTISPALGSDRGSISSQRTASGAKLSDGAVEITMNQELRRIFDIIGDPTFSRAGIAQLYEYQKANPLASSKINTWMATTGNYFQTYLKRALENLEIAERERDGPAPGDFAAPASAARVRPASGASSRNSNPTSPSRSTPRTSRMSVSSFVATTNGQEGGSVTPGARLAELQSVFGFAGAAE